MFSGNCEVLAISRKKYPIDNFFACLRLKEAQMNKLLNVFLKLAPPLLSDFAKDATTATLISESFPWQYFLIPVSFGFELSVLLRVIFQPHLDRDLSVVQGLSILVYPGDFRVVAIILRSKQRPAN